MARLSRSITNLFASCRPGRDRRQGSGRRPSVRVGGERLESRALLAATPAPLVTLEQDTGSSAIDRVTSVGVLEVKALDAASIEYSVDAGKTWTTAFVAKEGVNTVRVRQTLQGTAASAPTTFSFTLDTTTPAAPTASLANDTGGSKVDRVTKDATLSFVSPVTKKTSLEAGATVQYRTSPTLPWSSSFAAVEGANAVSVRQVDKAGNPSAETLVEFTLDKTAPVAPGVSLTNDTNLPADKITADGTLLLAASGPNAVEADATVQYSTDGGKSWTSSFTPRIGANSVLTRQIDLAGNASASTIFAFTFDKTAPAKPLLSLLADTGVSKVDRITKDGTISLVNPSTKKTSIEAGAAVEYSVLQPDGSTWSTWSSSFTATAGANTLKARQIDVAGNVSAESTPLAFTLFGQPPTIDSVVGPAAKAYKVGEAINVILRFSRPVVVSPLAGATPAIDITIGGVSRKATYTGGSGTASISFVTMIPTGAQGAVAAVGTIVLPTSGSQAASIRDLAGNDAPTSFSPADFPSAVVDAVVPVVQAFSFDVDTRTATIVFSRPVTGVSAADFRVQGTVSGVSFYLPLADSRIVAQIGQSTVTGGGTTWQLTVDRLPGGKGAFTLVLVANGSGIVDTAVGNPLVQDGATSLMV